MIIWLSLLIPLVGAFIMLRWFLDHLAWWEVIIPIFVCLIFTLVFKFSVEKIETTDTEYHSGLVVKAEYYEPYTTWVHKTCSRTVKVGKTTTTVYYDCSYCDENPPQYKVVNDLNESFSINRSFYEQLQKRWNSRAQFVELNRDIDYHGSCGQDGDKYEIYWDKNPINAEQTVTSHWYENRIQAAHSAFDFPDVSDEEIRAYKLFDYPEINEFSQDVLLGEDSIQWMGDNDKWTFNRLLQYSSGYWGPKKHGKIWVLLFQDQPQTAALMQESYWDGGNDNDLVVCIGLSSATNHMQWVKAFSWTPNREILVNMREDIKNIDVFNPERVSEAINKNMEGFERKDFKEFNYVTVDPPTWSIIVTYIVTILLTVGLCYWAVVNNIVTDEEELIKRIDNRILSIKERIKNKWNIIISKTKQIFTK